MSKLGADPESLRRLATTFERAGEGLEDDARSISRKMRATRWDGADAQRYLAAWDGQHKATLMTAASTFTTAAKKLREEAKAQEQTSGEGGGSSGDGAADKPRSAGTGHFAVDDLKHGWSWGDDNDQDKDGITDDVDPDRNGDGVTDTDDTDKDGIPDFRDDDDDGDGQKDRWDDKVDVGVNLAEGRLSGQFGGDRGEVDGSLFGGAGAGEASGWYGGRADLAGKVGIDEEGNLSASGSAQVAVGAGGEAKATFANDYASAELGAEGFVGARATVDGTATIGPDGLGVAVGVEAFAGAEASVEAKGTVLGASVGAEATAYAGAGVKLDVDAEIGWEKTEFDFDVGAALGIGAGISFSVELSPKDTVEAIGKLADDLLPDIDWTPW